MAIRIPYNAKAKDGQPLQRCIEHAAREHGITDYDSAAVLTYFLERVALEVAAGRLVVIPGFGAFGPLRHRKKDGLTGDWFPAFLASIGFRNEVRYGNPPSPETVERFLRFRRNHNRVNARVRRRVHSAMRQFRDDVRKQRRRLYGDD